MNLPHHSSRFLFTAAIAIWLLEAGGAQTTPRTAMPSATSPNDVTESVLYSFPCTQNCGIGINGSLVEGLDGNFYGTVTGVSSGLGPAGGIFRLTPDGQYAALYSFGSSGADGINPAGPLVQTSTGTFYGTTASGGDFNQGTVFSFDGSGAETVIYSFGASSGDGAAPFSCASGMGLVKGIDGILYGTTCSGGSAGAGTVFQVSPSGKEAVLHSFSADGVEGKSPGGLVQDASGNLFGFASGGLYDGGVVYELTAAGNYSVLHNFGASSTDGKTPTALLIGRDGALYGTTLGGGAYVTGAGTMFKLSPDGSYTTLYSFGGFCGLAVGFPDADGACPMGLIQGSDGNFYGITSEGGYGRGTVFEFIPGMGESVLHTFQFNSVTDAANPMAPMIQGSSGAFYGIASRGGSGYFGGAVYSLSFPIAPAPPSSLVAAGGDGRVKLQWQPATAATSYDVYAGITPGGEWSKPVRSGITATSAVIGGLTNKTKYYFTVVAVNATGTSPASSEVSAVPHRRKP